MKSVRAVRRKNPIRIPSAKSGDQPATRKMLRLVRDELCHRMDKMGNSIRAELKAEINGVKSEINGVKAEINGVKAEQSGMKADIADIKASQARMELLLEEQNANNRVVLEGLQLLWQRQSNLEREFEKIR